jgi:hypothetical protein
MKPRRKKPEPKKAKASEKREGALIAKLCQEHNYMFQDAPKGKRVVMTMAKDDSGKTRVDMSYRILLIVPSTSALGKRFAERYNQIHGTKR